MTTLLLLAAKALAILGGLAVIAAVWYELEPGDLGRMSESWRRRQRRADDRG